MSTAAAPPSPCPPVATGLPGRPFRPLLFFGHGFAHVGHGFCGFCAQLLSCRFVPRTVTQSHHSRARRTVFLLDPFAGHANFAGLGGTSGRASAARCGRVHIGVCHGVGGCLGGHGWAGSASGSAGPGCEVFLHHPAERHADFCDPHFLRLPRPFQSVSAQAPDPGRHSRVDDRRPGSLANRTDPRKSACRGAGLLHLPHYADGL